MDMFGHSWPPLNGFLWVGGLLSFMAALLHVICILGGPDALRFFGAGEKMARMAEAGSVWPAIVTLGIAVILFVWGCYAWTAAVIVQPEMVPLRLPFLKEIIVAITMIYLVRGLIFVPIDYAARGEITSFAVWSSAICLGYGVVHAVGLWQIWSGLSAS